MIPQDNFPIKLLKQKYLLALIIIISTICISFAIKSYQINMSSHYALLINMSGKQRMLSQKVAILAQELGYSNSDKKDSIKADLKETIALMNSNHAFLTQYTISIPYNLEQNLLSFYETTNNLIDTPNTEIDIKNPQINQILLLTKGELIQALNLKVSDFQKESESKTKELEIAEIILLLATLLVLGSEHYVIFRPLQKTLHQTHRELEYANQELILLSSLDGLTGVTNRRYLDNYLDKAISTATQTNTHLSAIMVDIDYFKAYNDTYGHLEGDNCLKKIATILKQNIRNESEVVARYGGEEFTIILPKTNIHHAAIIAERIRKEIEDSKIEHKGSLISNHVTISLGVAELVPNRQPELGLALADQALYKAKQGGRNQVYCWPPELLEQ
ncbi:diguanylate cyclase [Heliophilum fasciatum]|uniref:Diguanylate cyclase (GGDEF)-like protein n=1 Tax=Heliophilum fasciatum TaxID=35700 RepID=A0A4R2RK37_9FIRM|nr:diguanylate cyclase [Heliophilum fasciatum]MCW2278713.1 diguanylate cyclase (GGDEF)-like protein [Heliophilum fasciatum]TCP62547.1 diguanylate cyclase (GGDEF)-like protein [Heliophilum fasciatum]